MAERGAFRRSSGGISIMFERYTEKARRVIFFARYEASQFGSPYIETEHLLLGLLREDKALTNRFLRSHASVESIRKQIEGHTTIREKVSTSVDLPLSNECKRVLAYAAEEAERLSHKHIGTEHLLLGMLREKDCLAARLLNERGLQLEATRIQIAADAKESLAGGGIGSGVAGATRRNLHGFRIVDQDTSELLLILQESATPRVGDSILISEEGSPGRRYRVRDVLWEFVRVDGVHRLCDVVVKVAKDDAVSGGSLMES